MKLQENDAPLVASINNGCYFRKRIPGSVYAVMGRCKRGDGVNVRGRFLVEIWGLWRHRKRSLSFIDMQFHRCIARPRREVLVSFVRTPVVQ